MRRVWMVFAAVMICWGVQAQEGFDAKMRRAGLVDVLAVDSTLRVKLMYSAPDNFMRRDVYGDLETAYLLPHFARKVAAAQRLLRERRPGWRLLVCDAARPVSVQRQMYELVKGTPNQVYVADGTRGGRHNYGVAVDVTLLDETGAPGDMGTPGDFFGERQHGLPKLKIADMLNDMQILQEAQQCAKELTERDPELSSPALRGLRAEMRRLFASNNGTVTL